MKLSRNINIMPRKHELERRDAATDGLWRSNMVHLLRLVFNTSGVMGHECSIYHFNLELKLSVKRNDEGYYEVVRYLGSNSLFSC